jgi:hypothetical protein
MDLLEWSEQRARASDPVTSHNAAAEIAPLLSELQTVVLDMFRQLEPATSNEVAVTIEPGGNLGRINTLRRRASDLVQMKRLRVVGQRPCNVTGKTASVYEVVK